MMSKFDWHGVRETCAGELERVNPVQASNAVLNLGPMARWLLRREVFLRAADDSKTAVASRNRWQSWHDRPRVPNVYGACWAIFVNHRPEDMPLARQAFVLPLRWVPNSEHSMALPLELRELAAITVKSMRDVLKENTTRWGLHFWANAFGVDLSGLGVRAESAWAPLAAGLYVASQGGTPDPTVWATGSWSFSDGLLSVEDIALKSRVASEFGARTFYVPSGQQDQVPAALGLSTHSLQAGTLLPSRALQGLLLQLDAPPAAPTSPDDADALDRCANYYLRHPLNESETKTFYLERLLPFIIERRHREVRQQYPACRPTHLVTIVSGSPELVELTARALNVDHCLLLHTGGRQEELALLAQQRLESAQNGQKRIDCTPEVFENSAAIIERIKPLIQKFVAGISPQKIVFDLTPGTKMMTYALSRLSPAASWLVYLQHGWREGRPAPDTEKFHAWQVADR
jgi:hypothetical protein